MLTGAIGAVAIYVIVWYIILPFLSNYYTIKWNEESRGRHRHLYGRRQPTPCELFQKDCPCPKCSPPDEYPPEQGPFR